MALFRLIPLLLTLSIRNVALHRSRTLAIAGLLAFGTILVVMGLSILGDVERAMKSSIINSVAGDIQIYSSDAKDELALFGGSFMGREDIGSFADYAQIEEVVTKIDNVASVVPMGFDMSMLSRGSEMDDLFDSLRKTLSSGSPSAIDDRIDAVRQQLSFLREELTQAAAVSSNKEQDAEDLRQLERVETDAFWQELRRDPEPNLIFLESKIAPLSGEKAPIYLRYMGTDIEKFRQNFSKFQISEGESFGPGQRGILISRKTREDFLKNLPARLLDKLRLRSVEQGFLIAKDAESKRLSQDLSRQYMQILVHLDREEVGALEPKLMEFLKIRPEEESKLKIADLLQKFLVVDDGNIEAHYDFFYAQIAPKIRLYEISPGETIVLRAYTRSGYAKALPVKVYGVFNFAGIEDSDLAGAFCILDMVSFRDLYGQMNATALAELSEMRESAQVKQIERANAEDELFGEGAQIEATTSVAPSESDARKTQNVLEFTRVLNDQFAPSETKSGLALNLAVFLKDGKKNRETISQIQKLLSEANIGAKVVDWQTASGFIGQFVGIVRAVLLVSVGIIMLVALIIINNSLVVSVLNRTREIGTMRAIGAQKSFVVQLFLAEISVIAFIGVLPGMLIALAALTWLGKLGIPAGNEIVSFLFSGPKLFPTIDTLSAFLGPVLIVFLATMSSFYAALFAAKIRPSEAMQEKE